MAWYSLLPEEWAGTELWATRVFLLLGLATIFPWAILLTYDLLLYTGRTVTYEIPVVGGRARGQARPRAPSLKERPDGRPRNFSISMPGGSESAIDDSLPVPPNRVVEEKG